MTTGMQLMLDGQDAALAAATVGHHDHVNRLDLAIYRLIGGRGEWSADDVRDALPDDTKAWLEDHGNVLASLIGQHSRAKRIRQIGWCDPRRARRRTNPNRTWQAA